MTPGDIFDKLMVQVHQRAQSLPEGSYTTKLIRGGPAKMGAKILEETLETVLAASECDSHKLAGASDDVLEKAHSHLVYEACDVIYHLWVLLGSHGVTVEQLRRELERREGVSGLDEKKSRKIEGKS
ncbi:MAG: phosphoribosyl-ATP diphosphatase [Planctomycetota bacterium]|nr:phosphoribosyl-ATP diphosphatase [Planctomycetota bacterium]